MSTAFMTEIDHLVRARYSLIHVETWEEERARWLLAQVAERQHKDLFEWSITDGLRKVVGGPSGAQEVPKRIREPLQVLNEILQADTAALYVLKDFHRYLEAPEVVRQLRDLSQALRRTRKTLLLLSPGFTIPVELDKCLTVVELQLPDYEELRERFEASLAGARKARGISVDIAPDQLAPLIKAAQGLTLAEAENAFARAIVQDQRLDGSDVAAIIQEKQQIIRKSALLECCDVEEGLESVGGMDLLKQWLDKRARAFSEEARAYGIPAPRGVLLMGVQGCGKSLVAKTIAATWRMPLIRMDMSRIFHGYIGSSEANMRRALRIAETLSPAILWIDEIEKAFSGVQGSASTDAGTTARVVGQFLVWMQEKRAPVFVVGTANDVSALPPELMRKGRLDEIFFIDLPRGRERAEIFQIHLRKIRRDPAKFDLHALVAASKGFSGAEIEQAILDALHSSFFEEREIVSRDILESLAATVPLSRTMRETIDALRAWAEHRARPVTARARQVGAALLPQEDGDGTV
jgi:AAA+ superfamily predicted ATPase